MDQRIRYGFWVVVIGLGVIVAIFVSAITRWTAASDVTSVVGSAAGVVGTVVGAFFGVQLGSAGKEKAEEQRKAAEDKALAFAAALPPDESKRIMASLAK